MTKVRIPDPLNAEIIALDKAFYKWLEEVAHFEHETQEYWAKRWSIATHEPLVYTREDIEEGWGSDYEDFAETNNLAVDRLLNEEIARKRSILQEINEDFTQEN